MRRTVLASLLFVSAALADAPKPDAYLAKGEKALEAARDVKGTKLLRALEAAKPHYRRARAAAARGWKGAPGDEALTNALAAATKRLVGILNAETVIYLDRGNLSLAAKRNAEALALLPKDVRAKVLEGEVKDPEPKDEDASLVDSILRGDRAFARAGSLGARLRDRQGANQRFLERRAQAAR
jgi:hypothetical protein